jgi:endonuclease/exonuclease/phosphatase family metal-dependent hydrolase
MKWFKRFLIFLLFAAGFLVLFLAIMTLADYRPDELSNVPAQGKAVNFTEHDTLFSITSWNIGYFGLGAECDFFFDGGKMSKPLKADYYKYSAGALKYLKSMEKTDFYFFQEVDLKAARSYHDNQPERFREVLTGYESALAVNYNVLYVPVPLRQPMGRVKSALLSFSRFQSIENTRYAFPTGYSWPVGLFQLDRCFLLTRIALPAGKDLVLINTHNEAFDDGSQRKKQLAVLKDLMMEEYAKGNYVITGGDWNQNPVGFGDLGIGRFSNFDVRRVIEPAIEEDFMPEGWRWVFDPNIPSNRDVITPYERGKTKTTIIDFFVVSPNVEVLEVYTEDLGFQWCDHQPVRMVFSIK